MGLVLRPVAERAVITAVTRGLNMPIAEGLLVESEQFAALAGSHDLGEGLAAWKALGHVERHRQRSAAVGLESGARRTPIYSEA
jgi:hypothetical protein